MRPRSASTAWGQAIDKTLHVLAELIALEAGPRFSQPDRDI
jgi:hypothetical protein